MQILDGSLVDLPLKVHLKPPVFFDGQVAFENDESGKDSRSLKSWLISWCGYGWHFILAYPQKFYEASHKAYKGFLG